MKVFLADNYVQVKEKIADIAEQHGNNLDEGLLVFCEEKFTMAIEQKIAERCGGGFNNEVSSFNLFLRKNSDRKNVLSRQSSSVVMRKIMSENADKLSCFNAGNKPTLPVTIYELIAQLKSAKVKPQDVSFAAENVKGTLKSKLSDIALIFDEYEKYLLNGGYLDTNNSFAEMPEMILKNEKIKRSTVVFAGFPSVTGQIADVINAVILTAKETVFVLVGGKNEDLYLNETLSFLRSVGQILDIEKCNYYINDTAKEIRDNLFCPTLPPAQKGGDGIKAYVAKNLSDEVKQTALRITYEVKRSNMRYQDFTVAVGDLPTYKLLISKYFKDYDIPFYIDESIKLSSHPIIKLIVNCFDVYIRNFDMSKVLSVVTDDLFCSDKDVVDKFVGYVMRYAVTRYTIKNKFTEDVEDIEKIEELRSRFISIFDTLKRRDSVTNYVRFVKRLIEICEVEQNLSSISEKLNAMDELVKQSFNEQSIDKLQSVLLDLDTLAGDDFVDVKEFCEMLLSGAEACNISILPQYADCVYVGDFSSAKYKDEKYLFALGLNADVPHVKADTAVLTDNDLCKLDSLSVVIEPKISIVNKRERESVGLTVTSFSGGIYISYSMLDVKGKADVAGELFKDLCKLFSIKERNYTVKAFFGRDRLDENKNVLLDYISLRPGTMNFMAESCAFASKAVDDNRQSSAFYKAVEKLDQSATTDLDLRLKGMDISMSEAAIGRETGSTDLYFTDGQVSVTTLEDYFSCPYKCFLKHGLKIKESDDGAVKVTEFGTFLHAVLEEFVNLLKKDKQSITDENLRDVVCKIFDTEAAKEDYARYLNKKQISYAFGLLKEEALSVCREIYCSYKTSSFIPFGTEVRFGDNERFPAVKLKTGKKEYKVRGVVDRADVCGDYIRIVDYKSGKIKDVRANFYDESMLYSGKKLQLYLYMNAFVNGTGYKPAGMYYCAVNNNYRDEGETEYRTKLMGKTLFSDDVASKSDNSLAQGHAVSDIINIKYSDTKSKGFNLDGKDMLTEDEMEAYLKYAKVLSEKAIDKINEGYILTTPYEGSCTYCKFNGICGYDDVFCRTRSVNASGDTIKDAVKKEEENG